MRKHARPAQSRPNGPVAGHDRRRIGARLIQSLCGKSRCVLVGTRVHRTGNSWIKSAHGPSVDDSTFDLGGPCLWSDAALLTHTPARLPGRVVGLVWAFQYATGPIDVWLVGPLVDFLSLA
jgi:hypothetical protein